MLWSNDSCQGGKAMFSFKKSKNIRLVVGLNQVDNMMPNGWDTRLNMPKKQAEREIEARCNDIVSHIANTTKISRENIEYYSATKRYRLYNLLSKVVKYANTGFRMGSV